MPKSTFLNIVDTNNILLLDCAITLRTIRYYEDWRTEARNAVKVGTI